MKMHGIAIALASFCLSAAAQPNWTTTRVHEIETQTVKNTRLSHEQLSQLQTVVGPTLKECSNYPSSFEKKIELSDLRMESVVLSPTVKGYAVQGMGSCMCGATGNCAFWLLDSRLHLLLDSDAQGFAVLLPTTHGMHDVVLSLHGSATDSEHTLYRFDGRRYQRSQCADVDFAPTPERILKNPKVTLEACTAE